MPTAFEDLRMLKSVEEIADAVYRVVARWDEFARDVVGKQLARSTDSIGANIAESFGRFHWGEKVQFLYYARGSLFETKYWLNRAASRELFTKPETQNHSLQLSNIARQLNNFIASLKSQKSGDITVAKTLRESPAQYITENSPSNFPDVLFDEQELIWPET